MRRFAPAACGLLAAAVLAAPAFAHDGHDHRELGAHEHGTGTLDLAIEGNTLSIRLEVPGADIVGFEHEAESEADRAAIADAIEKLEKPLALFSLPENARCEVVEAHAGLAGDDHHGEEGHEGEKAHDAHADEAHDHAHSEFHAEYVLACAAPSELGRIGFTYFDAFPNALKLRVQLVSEKGATGFEVPRERPALDITGRF